MKNFGLFFLWMPVFFGLGVIGFDLFHPDWKIIAGISVGSFILLLGAFFSDPLLKLAHKLQLFHPARLVRLVLSHIFKILFYLLILPFVLPLFSQALLFVASLAILRRLFKIFRWLFSPEVFALVKPFIRKIFNLIPWRFVWRWGKRIWKVYIQRTWAGEAMSFGSSRLFQTIQQPMFWVKKMGKKVFQKFRRYQIKTLRWSLRYLQNPKISFLKNLIFLRQKKLKFDFSFRPSFHSRVSLVLTGMIFVIALGVLRMGWRTTVLDTAELEYSIYQKEIVAIVLKNEVKGEGQRLRLKPHRIGSWTEDLPEMVQLSRKTYDKDLRLGDKIIFYATVFPPGKPVAPGAFDFQRYAYYQGISGVGYISEDRPMKILEKHAEVPFLFEKIREDLSVYIQKILPNETGLFVLTVFLGERYALPQESLDIFQKSGLSHLMSVSGFHLALLGLIFFVLVRFLLVLILPLSKRLDVKKIAAGASLVFLTFFLFLSDARLPTQRAYIMTALAMVAILMNRSPFSLRLLGLSALIILGLTPEALFNPGFQMSFACAGALIFVYNRYSFSSGLPSWQFPIRRVLKFLVLTFLTSIIAFVATAPFVVFHFHTLSIIGPLANLFAIPLFSFVLLPLSLVTLSFPLFGGWLEKSYVFFKEGATYFSNIDWGFLVFSQTPAVFIYFVTFAGLIFILWPFKWRKTLAGLLLVMALFSTGLKEEPWFYVNKEAKVIAYKDVKTGKLVFPTNPNQDKYASAQWLLLNGEKGSPQKTKLCYRQHPCFLTVHEKKFAIIRRFTDVLKYLPHLCEKVDYVILPYGVDSHNSTCEGKIVDLSETEKGYFTLSGE
ncbi:MAG: ComEC/Rec2 family competence protein [Alphaproteobacteria bacterium]|nr:ComEC/Rec2 family competence protein [Alphaproteobacteria bacterium]